MSRAFFSLHPFVVFFYYLCAFILCMVFFHPVFLAVAAAVHFGLNVFYVSLKKSALRLVWFLLFGVLTVLINASISHRGSHILFYAMDEPVTLETILYAVTLVLMLTAVIFIFTTYHEVMTTDKFLFLFHPLSPKSALLVTMVLRFVPLLKRRFQELQSVQRANGIHIAYGSLRKRWSDGIRLLQTLLTLSLEESLQTADSMKARGFGTYRGRSSYLQFTMAPGDWILLSVMSIIFTGCMVGALMGFGKATFFPRMGEVEMQGLEWFFFAAFLLFHGMPILFEGVWQIRWRLLK